MRHAPLPKKKFSKLVSDVLRPNKNLLFYFGDLEGFIITRQNLLPGWKIFFSREEIEFLACIIIVDEKKFEYSRKYDKQNESDEYRSIDLFSDFR